ncbi:MAG: chorismate synthase [Candidatus Thorarchaeota archaeon]|jgi:chorismate synthase
MTFSFGKEFRIQVYGESHGEGIGVVVEGVPPGLVIDESKIQMELNRRRPGVSSLVSARSEKDTFSIRSGVFSGKSTGAPISMYIPNSDVDSSGYEKIRDTPRPGHADYTARIKYDNNNDYRGGGIFSGRMTAAFVMAGALAKQVLMKSGISVFAHTVQIGKVKAIKEISIEDIEKTVFTNSVRSADRESVSKMEIEIANAKKEGDSVGGIIECRILGIPVGLGEPIFDSVESVISHAMFSVPGIKGIEFGSGFHGASLRGSENNDSPVIVDNSIQWSKNDAGGILGGISNGAPIVFRVAVKPTASIAKKQMTVDLVKMGNTSIQIEGRHDPCIVPRAVAIIEGMAAVVIMDLMKRAGFSDTRTHF